jgi:peroxiredoxin
LTSIFYSSYAALWLLVIFQSLVLLGLVRTVYRANTRPVPDAAPEGNGYLIGQPAPKFSAVDISGSPIDETSLADRLTALLFVSPDCSTCTATLDEVEALRSKTKGNVIVVCRGTHDECSRLGELYSLEVPVIVDGEEKVAEVFDVHVTPTAVLVGRNGRIQTYGHPMRGEELEELVTEGHAHG